MLYGKRRCGMVLAGLIIWAGNCTGAWADPISDNIRTVLSFGNSDSLDVFAQDMGALLGGGSFHQGRGLGYPLGFDLGVHIPVIDVRDDNAILADNGDTEKVIWEQLELVLPHRFIIIGRLGQYENTAMSGIGLGYGLFVNPEKNRPTLTINGIYSTMDHQMINLETYSINAVASINFPYVDPYLGVGLDRTTAKPKQFAFEGVPANVDRTNKGKSTGVRMETGINIRVIPFTYFNFGIGLSNGNRHTHIGGGIHF